MPELPEVRTVAKVLKEKIIGLAPVRIKKVSELDPLIEELKKVEIEVDDILSSLYQSISLFGEDPDLTIKEYQIMMKGVKKLEVIKGFLIDRIEEKTYMEYEKVV